MLCEVLEPPERIGNGFRVLRLKDRVIGGSHLEPSIAEQVDYRTVSGFGEVGYAVKVGASPSLPFSDPVDADYPGALEAHQVGFPEFVPCGMVRRAVTNCERKSESYAGQSG
jgi:hypothetical protein